MDAEEVWTSGKNEEERVIGLKENTWGLEENLLNDGKMGLGK